MSGENGEQLPPPETPTESSNKYLRGMHIALPSVLGATAGVTAVTALSDFDAGSLPGGYAQAGLALTFATLSGLASWALYKSGRS